MKFIKVENMKALSSPNITRDIFSQPRDEIYLFPMLKMESVVYRHLSDRLKYNWKILHSLNFAGTNTTDLSDLHPQPLDRRLFSQVAGHLRRWLRGFFESGALSLHALAFCCCGLGWAIHCHLAWPGRTIVGGKANSR